MTLLSDTALKNITQSLLLNAYTVEPAGFIHGKAGIALTLFELARFNGEEYIEDHAFDLLQEALTYDVTDCDFVNGTSGIAYVIQYLVKNRLLDADYMDLYGEQHQNIIKDIKSTKYKEQDSYKYISDLFFTLLFSEYISENDYKKCIKILSDNIYKTLDKLHKKTEIKTGMHFHRYACRILSICNITDIENEIADQFFYKIKKTQNKLDKLDYVCEEPLFAIQYYISGILRNKNNIQEESKKLVKISLDNILIPALTFRQKTDLAFWIYKLYNLNNALDYREVVDHMIKTFTDDNLDKLEKKIYNNVFKKSSYAMGIGTGVSRLILLDIYWQQIQEGNFPENLVQLLN